MVMKSLLLVALLLVSIAQASCSVSFGFSSFQEENEGDLILQDSEISFTAIQVTRDVSDTSLTLNQSGRALYGRPLRLGTEPNFNSTFVLNISNKTDLAGEGLAFILTGSPDLPDNSHGQWLGIVNQTTNGSTAARTLAVELDTRKSYPEDLDDNHVGLDLNSVYSITQQSLSVKLSEGKDVTVKVQYGGGILEVFVGENETTPVISEPIDLSDYLPEKIYVGFSASTGNYSQLNCVKSWEFRGLDFYNKGQIPVWVFIVVPVAVVFFIFVLVFFYCKWKRKNKNGFEEEEEDDYDDEVEIRIQGSSAAPRKFRLEELKTATENFKSKLGQGGFGTVYRGLLENKAVAVKKFSRSAQGGKQDFIAEVTTIGNLNHKNLVKLLGWCSQRNELILVYEFMPNTSLDKFIYDDQNQNGIILDWGTRRRIIDGVAQALDYLHNGCDKRVLHRDIKASNIMLDSDFNARLGDFGLARIIDAGDRTHHSTKAVAGTPGYMAPESILTWRATVDTDVYAFGVLVLEVISGRFPGDERLMRKHGGLVDWVWASYSAGRVLDVVNPQLNGDFNEEEIEGVLTLALACCSPSPYQRPSIKTALQVLSGEVAPPAIPKSKPAFMWPAAMDHNSSFSSKDYSFGGSQPSPFPAFPQPSGR